MKKRKTGNLILIFIMILGIGLMAYPSFSNFINLRNASRIIGVYNDSVTKMRLEDRRKLFDEAIEYNNTIAKNGFSYQELVDADLDRYNSILDVTGTGIMGYIEIPILNINLPIYHGTEEEVLTVGIGHTSWSSLPAGGETCHTILSGHRGLPSAKLFTDIDLLNEGDLFFLKVLDETIAYEVDQINIVLPEELDLLTLDPGRDYCTLVTCTPYGINTHRLLVRGHRVEADDREYVINNEASQIRPYLVAAAIAVPLLVVLFIIAVIKK